MSVMGAEKTLKEFPLFSAAFQSNSINLLESLY